MKCILPFSADKVIRWHRLRRGGAPRSESKSDDRRGRSHHNSTAISRPVVSPMGKQRRRKAPTMQYQTFANAIRRYIVETWYILQYRNPGLANTVLPKNLPRWRAANSRPYVWCVQRWRAANSRPYIWCVQRWRADDPPLHWRVHVGGQVPPNFLSGNFSALLGWCYAQRIKIQ